MKNKTTCGIFLFNRDGKFLVGHPTNSPSNVWSIPKGIKDDGEDDFGAAIRELYEETNISLKDIGEFEVQYIGDFAYSGNRKKILSAFYINTSHDFYNHNIICESMVISESGNFPEVDDFKWVNFIEAQTILNSAQIQALDIVNEIRRI